jgi:hypothetical protein
MFRGLITSSVIVAQLVSSTAHAQVDGVFYYRHHAGVVVSEGGTQPEQPVPSGPFIARNIGGTEAALILGADEPGFSIGLFDTKTNEPFYGAQDWQLVSGVLPNGISAEITPDKQSVRFTGVATAAGEFPDIVYRIKDSKGNEVTTKPLKFTVVDSGLSLYPWPDETPSAKAMVEPVSLRIVAGNTRPNFPLSWSVSGTLPAGVTYASNGNELEFYGVADVAGRYDGITVGVRDALGRTKSIPVAFNITGYLDTANSEDEVYLDTNASLSATTTVVETANGQPYTGGVTWSLQSGPLPAGIAAQASPDGSRMIYSGSTAKIGTYDIVWLVSDANGNQLRTKSFRLRVGVAPELTLSSSRGSSIYIDTVTERRTTFLARNTAGDLGIPAANWTVTGNIPPGMTFESDDTAATLKGIPTKTGNFTLTVSATDTAGKKASIPLYVSIATGVELQQSDLSESLYMGLEVPTTTYRLKLSNTGTESLAYVNPATKWELVSGSLPAGVTTSVSGDRSSLTFVGKPTQKGVFADIVFKATDAVGNTYLSKPLVISVVERQNLQLALEGSRQNPQTLVGYTSEPRYISVRTQNAPKYGIPTGNWVVTGLPEGMTASKGPLNLSISGFPKYTGTYNVKVEATDTLGGYATLDVPITVENGLSAAQYNPTSETLTEYGVGPRSTLTTIVTSANTPYAGGDLTWTKLSGNLPPGVTATIDGYGSVMRFSGFAKTAGTYDNIVYRVADRYGNTFDTKPLTFNVEANTEALGINGGKSSEQAYVGSTVNIPLSAVGVPANETLSATNWTVTGLPDGVSAIVAADGRSVNLRGTPTKNANYTTVVTLKDRLNRTTSRNIAFQIGAGFKLVGSDINGVGSDSQILNMYSTLANRRLQIVNIETGELYTEGATWELKPGAEFPTGITTILSPDGSTMRTDGYATARPASWKNHYNYPGWNITLANGIKLSGWFEMALNNVAVSLGSDQTRSTVKDAPFSTSFGVTNFAGDETMSLSNLVSTGLPSGLSLRVSGSTVFVEGTPTALGTTATTITVTDKYGRTASAKLNLTVLASFNAIKETTSTGVAVTGDFNRKFLWATKTIGGSYTDVELNWTLETGALPPGLRLERSATDRNTMFLRGYTLTAGTWKSTWRATAPNGDYSITTEATITTSARTNMTLAGSVPTAIYTGSSVTLGTFTPSNTAYGLKIPDADWTVTDLPPGIDKSVTNGVLTLSGTPTTYGSYPLVVQAKDAAGQVVTYSRTVTVSAPIEAKATKTINGSAFTAEYNVSMLSTLKSGTTSLYSDNDVVWTVETGSIPRGLRLDKHASERNTLVLRGYAEETGIFSSKWRATLPNGDYSVTPEISIVVGNRTVFNLSGGTNISIAPTQTGNLGTFTPSGLAYNQAIKPADWTVANLPPGFSTTLANGNLSISGTATTEGVYDVIVTAKDASGATASRTVTATIKAPFRFIKNYGDVTLTRGSPVPGREVLLLWDDGNNYITTAKNLTLISGSLPPGITMSLGTTTDTKGTVVMSGTPTAAGVYRVRYQAMTSGNVPAQMTGDFVITVN